MRLPGIVLIVSSLLALIAIAHHPVARSASRADIIPAVLHLASADAAVHAVVIALALALLFSLTMLSIGLGFGSPATVAAVIVYAAGTGALLGAAIVDGFVVPGIAEQYAHVTPQPLDVGLRLLGFCAVVIQAATKVGLIATSAGVLLWSVELVRRSGALRAVGALGLVSALGVPAVTLATAAFDPSRLLAVLALQSVWYLAVGTMMVRGEI